MAAVRPMVTVQSLEGQAAEQVALPAVFSAPIRPDIVTKVHTDMNKNHRQAYAVKFEAGMDTAAESWGTGRAVSRIPRVPGGGTHRAGQGAFGNMCRGGRMFAPTKVWRKWHRKINLNQKRYAVASALAASAVPALVMARGHRVEQIAEIPLVLSDEAAAVTKTSAAVKALKALGAGAELEKCKSSKNIRAGKGKMRNRRYVMRKGPLVVYSEDNGISKSFRNIPGVECSSVNSLNLLQLAPGGHLGRMVIFTKSAFTALDGIFGSTETESTVKKGYKLPRTIMTNPDVTRLINSDEVQSIVNAPKETPKPHGLKKNPLKNLGAMLKINPYAKELKKAGSAKKTATRAATKAVGKAFLAKMSTDSSYVGPDYDYFAVWLGTAQKA